MGPNSKDSETIQFLMRNVPKTLHRRWKLFSVTQGVSMEEIAIKAIDGFIDAELRQLQKELEDEQ